MNSEQVSLRKYILMFIVYYAVALVSINIVLNIIDVDLGLALELLLVFSAASCASTKFVQDQSRAPTITEKRQLSVICTVASLLISALHIGILMLVMGGYEDAQALLEILNELPFLLVLIVMVAGLLLNYLMLNLAFGWFARSTLSKLKAKGKLA